MNQTDDHMMSETQPITQRLQELEAYLESLVASLQRGELPVNLKRVRWITEQILTREQPLLKLSIEKFVDLYNDVPNILSAYAINVNVTPESYRHKQPPTFSHHPQGNYWLIATTPDQQWLVPNPTKKLDLSRLPFFSLVFDWQSIQANNYQDTFTLLEPAIVSVLPIAPPQWRLLERGTISTFLSTDERWEVENRRLNKSELLLSITQEQQQQTDRINGIHDLARKLEEAIQFQQQENTNSNVNTALNHGDLLDRIEAINIAIQQQQEQHLVRINNTDNSVRQLKETIQLQQQETINSNTISEQKYKGLLDLYESLKLTFQQQQKQFTENIDGVSNSLERQTARANGIRDFVKKLEETIQSQQEVSNSKNAVLAQQNEDLRNLHESLKLAFWHQQEQHLEKINTMSSIVSRLEESIDLRQENIGNSDPEELQKYNNFLEQYKQLQGAFQQQQQQHAETISSMDVIIKDLKKKVQSQQQESVNFKDEITQKFKGLSDQYESLKTDIQQQKNPGKAQVHESTATSQHPSQPVTASVTTDAQIDQVKNPLLKAYTFTPAAFEARYQPIAVAERLESFQRRSIGRQEDVILEESRQGNCWIVSEGNMIYLLLNSKMPINNNTISMVLTFFDCPGNKSSYRKSMILQPAIVELQPNKIPRFWKLKKKGVIEFT